MKMSLSFLEKYFTADGSNSLAEIPVSLAVASRMGRFCFAYHVCGLARKKRTANYFVSGGILFSAYLEEEGKNTLGLGSALYIS